MLSCRESKQTLRERIRGTVVVVHSSPLLLIFRPIESTAQPEPTRTDVKLIETSLIAEQKANEHVVCRERFTSVQ